MANAAEMVEHSRHHQGSEGSAKCPKCGGRAYIIVGKWHCGDDCDPTGRMAPIWEDSREACPFPHLHKFVIE
jgi:hypothetical protein